MHSEVKAVDTDTIPDCFKMWEEADWQQMTLHLSNLFSRN